MSKYTDTVIETSQDKAHRQVKELVVQFQQGIAHYSSSQFQESEVRADFIDKFFKALGWDVTHEVQTNPYEQEVRIEKRVKKGNGKGRADYAFSIAPHFNRPMFFVEAKKPGVEIASADNYFQAIRYSWNAQLPLVVLTDFASFHVIDTRYRPVISSALSRLHLKFSLDDYVDPEKFAQLYWLFSREAVAAGSLANYVQTMPELSSGRAAIQMGLFSGGFASIDEDFLAKLDEYRETLARVFKRENSSLSSIQLTEMVQRTIDRLVFLRFLEDKLIEPDPIVNKIAADAQPWAKFVKECRRLDSIYNGVVFKSHAQLDTPDLLSDSTDFAAICDELSNAFSPYDFNSIPVEMLGRIYENFLGKVVQATPKRVSIEDKPAVRQAGGVYYTPDYIVRYMAEQSLDAILANRKPTDVLKLRVIDTSCGSGSFLIGVYEALLQRAGKLYFANPKIAKAGEWIERDGQWRLSFLKKRELLVQCLHGVDIDPQAVEVAQLSLYLKLMEDETTDSAHTLQREFEEALLPRLNKNIVVGNALTGPLDDAKNIDLFVSEAVAGGDAVNLRWTFPQVLGTEGGFDLVIGNPPYIKEYTHRAAFDGVRDSPYYQGKMDLWYLFACRGLDLLKPGQGRLALIATNNWGTNAGASKLRQKIVQDARIEQLIDFGDYKVFRDAGIQTMILLACRDNKTNPYHFDYRRSEAKKPSLADAQNLLLATTATPPSVRELRLTPSFDREKFAGKSLTFSDASFEAVLDSLQTKSDFQLAAHEVAVGIDVHQDFLSAKLHPKLAQKLYPGHGIFNLTHAELRSLKLSKKEQKLIKPFYTTSQLGRYFGHSGNELWIIYTDSTYKARDSLDQFPKLKAHLDQFKSVITSDNAPYGLHRARDLRFFVGEKIISTRKCAAPTFTFTDFDCFVSQTFNIIKSDRINLKFLTALLNSRVMRFWLKHRGKMQGKLFQVDKEPLLAMPLLCPAVPQQQALAARVDQILHYHANLLIVSTEAQRETQERRIAELDEQIQHDIYRLYGLSAEQIALIEQA